MVLICEAQATCVARSSEEIRRIEQADQDGAQVGQQDSATGLGVDGICLVFFRRIRTSGRDRVRVVSGASVMMSQSCRPRRDGRRVEKVEKIERVSCVDGGWRIGNRRK